MASYDEVMTALRNADAAGDTEAAQRLAAMARNLQGNNSSAKSGADYGIPDSTPMPGSGPVPTPTFGDKANATVEAITNTAASIPDMVAGGLYSIGNFASTLAKEGRIPSLKESEAAFNQAADTIGLGKTAYKNSSDLGQEYTDKLGEFLMGPTAIGAGMALHTVPGVIDTKAVLADRFKPKEKVVAPKDINAKLDALETPAPTQAQPAVDPNMQFYQNQAHIAQLQAQIDNIKRGQEPLYVDRNGVASPEVPKMNSIEQMRDQLGGKPQPEIPEVPTTEQNLLADNNPITRTAFDLENPVGNSKQFDAQDAIDRRNAQQAEDVANHPAQTTLDVTQGQNPALTFDPAQEHINAITDHLNQISQEQEHQRLLQEQDRLTSENAAKVQEAQAAVEERQRQLEADMNADKIKRDATLAQLAAERKNLEGRSAFSPKVLKEMADNKAKVEAIQAEQARIEQAAEQQRQQLAAQKERIAQGRAQHDAMIQRIRDEHAASEARQHAAEEAIKRRQDMLEDPVKRQAALEKQARELQELPTNNFVGPRPKGFNKNMQRGKRGSAKKQLGGLDPEVFKEGYRSLARALSKLTDQPWLKERFPSTTHMTNSDGTPLIMLHGTTADIKGGLGGRAEGFHAGFVSSPHIFTTERGKVNDWAVHDSTRTKNNAQVYPVAIKKGNYPFINGDIGMWKAGNVVADPRTKDVIRQGLREHGIPDEQHASLFKYIQDGIGFKDQNQRLTDVLKRAGIDGFFYKNSAESPKMYAKNQERVKGLQPATSFVTWDNKNFESVFKQDNEPTNPYGKDVIDMNSGIPFTKEHWDKIVSGWHSLTEHFHNAAIENADLMKTMADKIAKWDSSEAMRKFMSKSIPGIKENLDSKIPQLEDPKTTIQRILSDGATDMPMMSKFFQHMQSGMALTAAKFGNNPLLLGVHRALMNGFTSGEYQTRLLVDPVKEILSKMTSGEQLNVHTVMQREMFKEKRFTDEQISSVLNEREANAYRMMRQAFDTVFDMQNEKLREQGRPEMTRGEAYMASRAVGDWHYMVNDSKGRPVWYIRTPTKGEGMKALRYLREQFPDLNIGEKEQPKYIKNHMNPNTPQDFIGAYHDMMEFFKDDPETTSQIKSALENYYQAKGYSVAGQNKHFMEKNNVRGFLGDRPWLNPVDNAREGLKAQLDYLNNSLRWANMQKSMGAVKEIMANPEVQQKMPNAFDYARTVISHQFGLGNHNWFANIENAIAQYGPISRGALYGGMQAFKSLAYLMNMGLSVGHVIAAPIQAMGMTTARLVKLGSEFGFKAADMIPALSKAMADTFTGMSSHLAHEAFGYEGKVPLTDFGKQALQFAEDNGLITKNLFDESRELGAAPLSNRLRGIGDWTIGMPEKLGRLGSFMAIAHALNDSGKFADRPMELMQRAMEETNHAAVSFHQLDRPLVVNKLGVVGQGMYMYKSYLFNIFNQLSEMARTNKAAFGTALGMTVLLSGLQGFPLVNEADGAYNLFKDWVSKNHPDWYAKQIGTNSIGLKGHAISVMPQMNPFKDYLSDGQYGLIRDTVSHGLPSAATGINLQSRLNLNAFDVEHPMSNFGLPALGQEIKEQKGIYDFVNHPNKENALSAVYNNVPPLIQGQMETNIDKYKAGPGLTYNPKDLSQYQVQNWRRDATDQNIRGLGLYSLPEAKFKEAYGINKAESARVQQAQQSAMNQLVESILSRRTEDTPYWAKTLIDLNPDTQAMNKQLDDRLTKAHVTPHEMDLIKMKAFDTINNEIRLRSMTR